MSDGEGIPLSELKRLRDLWGHEAWRTVQHAAMDGRELDDRLLATAAYEFARAALRPLRPGVVVLAIATTVGWYLALGDDAGSDAASWAGVATALFVAAAVVRVRYARAVEIYASQADRPRLRALLDDTGDPPPPS